MVDSLSRGGIVPVVNSLLNAYARSLAMSRASRERTSLGMPSRPRAFPRGSRFRICSTSSLETLMSNCIALPCTSSDGSG